MVNSLFGETWRIAEFGSTNCQLGFERSRFLHYRSTKILSKTLIYTGFQQCAESVLLARHVGPQWSRTAPAGCEEAGRVRDAETVG